MQATIQVVWTVVAFALFVGIVVWAYSSKRKQSFNEAAQLPLHDEDDSIEVMDKRENNDG